MGTSDVVTIAPRPGYLRRDGDSLQWVDVSDARDIPALRRVALPLNQPLFAHSLFVAWIAFPLDREERQRIQGAEALATWVLRKIVKAGKRRRSELPQWALDVRTDRMETRVDKLWRRVERRMKVAEVFLPGLTLAAAASEKRGSIRYSGPSSVTDFATRAVAKGKFADLSLGGVDRREALNNARNRLWQHSRSVLHAAAALRFALKRIGGEGLEAVFDPRLDFAAVLKDAGNRRLTQLPSLRYSVTPAETVQFIPV